MSFGTDRGGEEDVEALNTPTTRCGIRRGLRVLMTLGPLRMHVLFFFAVNTWGIMTETPSERNSAMFVLDNTWLTHVLLIGLSLTTLSFVASLVLFYFASTEYYTLIGKRRELTADQREFERILMESTTAMMNGDRPMNLEIIELNAQYITRKH